jgi:hypothetical protein
MFVIAGDPKAVLLNIDSGTVVAEVPLVFSGQSSLDVLEFISAPDGKTLAIVSTGRVVGVDCDGHERWAFRPKFLLQRVEAITPNGFTLIGFDMDEAKTPMRRCSALFATGEIAS